MKNHYITADKITANDIKAARLRLGLTQVQFAEFVNVSKKTIERWESGKALIDGPIVTLLQAMRKFPTIEEQLRVPEKKLPMRLIYRFNEEVCTIIDVDERKQLIEVTNYTDDNMFKAFGTTEKPTYEDYLSFIESRCFPRERDKSKILLEQLDIPFYDPLLIIEKTEGKMAEDDFKLIIEH